MSNVYHVGGQKVWFTINTLKQYIKILEDNEDYQNVAEQKEVLRSFMTEIKGSNGDKSLSQAA